MTSSAESPLVLRVSRTVRAPRARVYRAWTEGDLFKQWWGRHDGFVIPAAELDVRVGGTWRIEMQAPGGQVAWITGRYLEVDPPQRLVWSWAWEMSEGQDWPYTSEIGETLVTVELVDRGDETEVVVTHEGFPSDPARVVHESAWNGSLKSLADFL